MTQFAIDFWIPTKVAYGTRYYDFVTNSGLSSAYTGWIFDITENDNTSGYAYNLQSPLVGPNDDYYTGLNYADRLFGSIGDDVLHAYSGDDLVVGGDGDDMLTGDDGNDTLYGDYSNRYAVTTVGGNTDAWTIPSAADLTLTGNDFLDGGKGADILYGGPGADQLHGGPRGAGFTDVLVGGAGVDGFYLTYGEPSETGNSGGANGFWIGFANDYGPSIGSNGVKAGIDALGKFAAKEFFESVVGSPILGGLSTALGGLVGEGISMLLKANKSAPPQPTGEDVIVITDFDPREDTVFLPLPTDQGQTLRADVTNFGSTGTKSTANGLSGWGVAFTSGSGTSATTFAELLLSHDFLDTFGLSPNSVGAEAFIEQLFANSVEINDSGQPVTGGLVNPDLLYPFSTNPGDYRDGTLPSVADTPVAFTAPTGTFTKVYGPFGPQTIVFPASPGTTTLIAGSNMGDLSFLGTQGFAPGDWDNGGVVALPTSPSVIRGFGGDDILNGGAGQDDIYGGDGDDLIYGWNAGVSPNRDQLYGEAGDDVLFAAKPTGGRAAAAFDGGDGNDTASFLHSRYGVTASLADGNGTNAGDAGTSSYSFVDVENLVGTDYADELTGDDNDNALQGHMGDDLIVAGGGDDLLTGGPFRSALYRVEAGGPTVQAEDNGPDWGKDTGDEPSDYLLSKDSLTQARSATILYDAATVAGAPEDIFSRFRYASAGESLIWSFPTFAPANYRVNLYLAEGDFTITQANERVFDVQVEDSTPTVFKGIDPWALGGAGNGGAGNQAFLLSYDVEVTDGSLDLQFKPVEGSPSVQAIEIVYLTTDNDTLDGGDGTDTVSYDESWGKVSVDLVVGVANEFGKDGGDDADTVAFADLLNGIENAIGSAFDDTLTGDDGDNVLAGGAGDNVLVGGGGVDTVSFAGGTTGLVLHMPSWSPTGPTQQANAFGGTDTITGFVNVIGGEGDDAITGDSRDNVLTGRAGKDTIVGGDGYDIVDFADGDRGIDIVLWENVGGQRTGRWIDAFGDEDTVDRTTVEAYRGTSGDDRMTGDGGNRLAALAQAVFFGEAGEDTLIGSGLDDQLSGGADDDTLTGLAGNDTLDGGDGDDVINAVGNQAQGLIWVNAGGPEIAPWAEDTASNPSRYLVPGSDTGLSTTTATVIYDAGAVNDAPEAIFHLARLSQGAMGWDIPLYGSGSYPATTGGGSYTVNLYIVEGYVDFRAANERVFDVTVEGVLPAAFTGIDPWVLGGSGNGGAGNRAFVLSHETTVTDGALSLEFIAKVNNPIIYGIEIIQNTTDDDAIDGGAGIDTVDYSDNAGKVVIDLSAGTASQFDLSGAVVATDTLANVEAVVGSVHADTLTGDAEDNILTGNLGDDSIDGGDGTDTADYSARGAGINATLSARDGDGRQTVTLRDGANYNKVFETDTLTSVEGVSGSDHDDELFGSTAGDRIGGGDGDDYLVGNEGKDTLEGGDGDDRLFGGSNGAVYRVNAAEPNNTSYDHTIKAVDGGPDWTFDRSWITGGEPKGGDSTATRLYDRLDLSMIPEALFDQEIWAYPAGTATSGGAMTWNLPVTKGYYLADLLIVEGVAGSPPPTRVFSVSFEGQQPPEFQNINPYRIGGSGNGGKGNEAFMLTSEHSVLVTDGALTLHFTASSENSKINAIQIRGWNTTADDDDILQGGAGDDWLAGYDGDDVLDGGTGNDWVNYEFNKGKVTVDLGNGVADEYGPAGGAEADTVVYTDSLTNLENVRGSLYGDSLSGDQSDNFLDGSAGADTLRGNAGRDVFTGLAADMVGDVILDLEDGERIEIGGHLGLPSLASTWANGRHWLELRLDADGDGLSDGSMTVTGDVSVRELDRLAIERQPDQSLHVTLRDAYSATAVADGGDGTNGDDRLYGSGAGDVIDGRGGDDVVDGNAGDDHLVAGAGDDVIRGEDGNDTIRAGSGDDWATGGRGDDDIEGGSGHDRLDGGDGDDVVMGLGGSDTLTGGAGDDTLTGGSGGGVGTGQLTSALMHFGPGPGAGGWASQDGTPRTTADIDGDGVADIVGFGHQRLFTALNDGAGGFDGVAAGLENFTAAQGWRSDDATPRLLGDVDGDGAADIVGFGARAVFVARADGAGGFSPVRKGLENFTAAQGWRSDDATPRLVSDVNGDGIADIVGFGARQTFTALGKGDGSFAPARAVLANFTAAQGWAGNDSHLRLLGDVDGDGLDDIVGFGNSGVFTALSNGDGTFGGVRRVLENFTAAQGWRSDDLTPRLIGDVNGDGLDDIVGLGARKTFAALALGDGGFGAPVWISDHFNRATGWSSNDLTPRAMAELNGGGAADLVGFSSMGVLMQSSTGQSDVFVFADGFGTDVVTDFHAGPDGDRLDLSQVSAFASFAEVLAAARQDGADTVITDGADSIRLTGVALSELTEGDVILA